MEKRVKQRMVYFKSARPRFERRCRHYPDGGGRGMLWALFHVDGGKSIFRCQQCLFDAFGFVPHSIRLLRKRRQCCRCNITADVVGAWTPLPLDQEGGTKKFLCRSCFVRIGERQIND